jgi:hypothetical protein
MMECSNQLGRTADSSVLQEGIHEIIKTAVFHISGCGDRWGGRDKEVDSFGGTAKGKGNKRSRVTSITVDWVRVGLLMVWRIEGG